MIHVIGQHTGAYTTWMIPAIGRRQSRRVLHWFVRAPCPYTSLHHEVHQAAGDGDDFHHGLAG